MIIDARSKKSDVVEELGHLGLYLTSPLYWRRIKAEMLRASSYDGRDARRAQLLRTGLVVAPPAEVRR